MYVEQNIRIRTSFIYVISASSQQEQQNVWNLLERNETRRVGSTNTGTTVLDGLVSDGELTQVVSNHFGLGS